MKEKNMILLSGLWKNESKDGVTYYAGKLGSGGRLLLFKNAFKRGEKDPELVLYITRQGKSRSPQEGNAEYV